MGKKWRGTDKDVIDVDDLLVIERQKDIAEQHNNMEVTLDIIKSLADVGTDDITDINRTNIMFAIKKLCEVGHM